MNRAKLRVFLSSRMSELATERQSVKRALADRDVDVFVFELDAGARTQSIQQTFLDEVEHADLYIGLFWKGYGQYTIDEFEHSQTLGMDCLIYEKREDLGSSRDPQLQSFLDRLGNVEEGTTIKWFLTAEELSRLVAEDVASWQVKKIREGGAGTQALYVGVPTMPLHFVGRESVVKQVVRTFRSEAGNSLAMEGLPGVGKSSIAIAIAHHAGILRRFVDGVLWAGLGRGASPDAVLDTWANALSHDVSGHAKTAAKAQALRDVVGQKRFLFVLDDAWDYTLANLLRCGGPNCGYLLTTGNKLVAHRFAGQSATLIIEPLADDSAEVLLKQLAPEVVAANGESAHKLLLALGGLPLAINLVGGYLAEPEHAMFAEVFPNLSGRAIEELMQPEQRLKLAQDRIESLEDETTTLAGTIGLSLHGLLPQITHAFHGLGAFAPEPATFTIEAARAVTGADDIALTTLAGRNLLRLRKNQVASMHPIISDYAISRAPEEAVALHRHYYLSMLRARKGTLDAVFLDVQLFQQINRAWITCSDKADAFLFFDLLQPYFSNRGMFETTLEWGERLLTLLAGDTQFPGTAQVLVKMSQACNELHACSEAIRLSMDALDLLQNSGDEVGVGRVYGNLSTYHFENDDSSNAAKYSELALTVLSEKDDYWGLRALYATAHALFAYRGADESARTILDALKDVEQQEKASPVKLQSPTDLSPVMVASIARDRSQISSCLPLLLLQYWLIDVTTPCRTRILLGIRKQEKGKDVYHYLVVRGEAGQQIESNIFTLEQSLKGKVTDVDLHLITNEEALTRVVLAQGSSDLDITELEGDLNQLGVLAKLIGSSARSS